MASSLINDIILFIKANLFLFNFGIGLRLMKKFFADIIDAVSYLFIGGDEKDHDEIPVKEKLRLVVGWSIGIIFCVVMLLLLRR